MLSVSLLLSATGCVSYTARALPDNSRATPELMKEVRVTLKTNVVVHMSNASLRGDSLVGQGIKQPYSRIAVASSNIAQLDTPKTRKTATIALIVLLSVVGVVVYGFSTMEIL